MSKRQAVGVAVGICFVAILFALYINKPPNPDQSIFDYIGWVGLQGGHYYLDVAEQNFPGEMLLHDLAFRLFGVTIHAYRALDFGILCVASAALVGLLRQSGFAAAAWVGAGTYLLGYVSSNAWMSGQRDPVAANMLLVGGYLFVRRLRGGGRLLLLPLGLLVFYAVLLRPTYLLFAVFLVAMDFLLSKRHSRHWSTCLLDAATVVCVSIAAAGGFVGWGAAVHSLGSFHEQAILFNLQAYSAGHSYLDTLTAIARGLGDYLLFVPAALLGVVAVVAQRRWEPSLHVLCGLAVLAPVSAFVQNKGFGYHVGAVLAPAFGLAGAGLGAATRSLLALGKRRFRGSILLGLAAILVAVGLLRQIRSLGPQIRYSLGVDSRQGMLARESAGLSGFTWADEEDAAKFARESSVPEETILVWGRAVGIHLLAQRRSPTRFITSGMLILAVPPFERAAAWQQEFADVMRQKPPRIVFLTTKNGTPDYLGASSSIGEPSGAIGVLKTAISSRYDRKARFGSIDAYVLRD